MRQMFVKVIFAFGFVSLLSTLFITFGVVISKYDILAEEYPGPSPSNIELGLCEAPKEMRTFAEENNAASIPVLLYHRILKEQDIPQDQYLDGEVNPNIVTTEQFQEQMTYLKENNFVTLTLDELYAFLTKGKAIPENSVVITFDDGYKDNYIEAYPILKEHGFTAANFIVTGFVRNKVHSYTPEKVQYFSRKELQESCDVFEFGSHTYTFHKKELRGEKKIPYLVSKPKQEVKEDIQTSFHQLMNSDFFAYPYGDYTPETIEILKELGTKMAFALEERDASPADHIYEVPRYPITYSHSFTEFKEYVD
ncbi:polysaccharide deacetylase family protein [Rossellomorea vietnamensis]|uniref:Polysaccharide deacetylase family protein n=1 Tax=Rossellomorea vietnamensis TaxID=218284 RepID=A0A5D4LYW6_9BACI|nr:polysaccharide deacetylase family protein [Rossellomorea vietnamensis]TYR94293.1 polysaccharide deacetylase family protein [Rossellomorea vietnamensis]